MSSKGTRLWFALFVVAVLGVGFVAGLIVGRRIATSPEFVGGGPGGGRPPGPGGRGGGPPSPRRLVERLDRDLQLTDDQEARIQQIFETRRPALERTQRDMRERMEQEQRELTAEIRGVLTPEQQPKFDTWLEEERARGRGRGRRGGPFAPPPDGRPPGR
jgi:Spy/CpxP family protein refolding chaperone